jgi:nucleoid-associated protein YgaU
MAIEGLYDRGYLVEFKEGDVAFYRTILYYGGSIYDKYHVVKEGETLLSIAQDRYGSQFPWFIIADVNAPLITDIFELVVGTSLLIPDLNTLYSSYVQS